jgi:Zn-dependent protease
VIQATLCPDCTTELADGLLSCPVCHRLVHGERLRQLAADAATATEAGDSSRALTAWREALALLPPTTEQARAISQKVSSLSAQVSVSPLLVSPSHSGPSRSVGGALTAAGAAALVLWKFKFVAVFLLTKAKFLVLGLTKASTFFSMLVTASVYWTIWGWWFAAGVIASIYVHEMGHVAALRRFGIPASAPMFVPGLGAFVRMHSRPHTPREDARVGLAGPLWGLGAVLAGYGLFLSTGHELFSAVAKFAAWLNLFNLIPVWHLDGSRGLAAITRGDRWLLALVVGLMWAISEEGLLVLILLVIAGRAWFEQPPVERDTTALAQFAALVVSLTLLTMGR